MSDSPDRNARPTDSVQTFPLSSFTDLSRFDKISTPQKNDAAPALPPLSIPSILDKPTGTADKILAVPPLPVKPADSTTDAQKKVGDQTDKIKLSPDGKLELSEKDFDKIGPKAAQVLKDAGVSKITITPGQGFDTYEAELKKPLEIPQDPSVDGNRKLKVATHFKADVSKLPDGTMKLDNIEGLTAETKVLLSWKDAQVNRIQLKQTADGKSEIKSTGSWNGFSRDNTRIKDGEIFEKANFLFDRMDKLKQQAEKTDYLDIPKLQIK